MKSFTWISLPGGSITDNVAVIGEVLDGSDSLGSDFGLISLKMTGGLCLKDLPKRSGVHGLVLPGFNATSWSW